MHAQTCEWCATPFIARTSRARFCSGACRSAASKARSASTATDGTARQPPGPVRLALEQWLVDTEAERHALADAVRTLADRIDAPGHYGLAESIGALRTLIDTIELTPSQVLPATAHLAPVDD